MFQVTETAAQELKKIKEQVGADRRRGNVHRENDPPDPDVCQPPFPDATPSQLVLHREVAGNAG